MAGKPMALASGALEFALAALSKNTLGDLVIDRARAELGEDATDEAIVAKVQEWLEPVCVVRGEKPPRLANRMDRVFKASAEFRRQMGGGEG